MQEQIDFDFVKDKLIIIEKKSERTLKNKVKYLKYLQEVRKILTSFFPHFLNKDISSNILKFCMFKDIYYDRTILPKYFNNKFIKMVDFKDNFKDNFDKVIKELDNQRQSIYI